MNKQERDWLLGLSVILSKVPPPNAGGGSSTPSIIGFIDYAEDMKALGNMVHNFIMGMVTLDNIKRDPELKNDWIEGVDYHHPDLVKEAINRWLKLRVEQKWESANADQINRIYEQVRIEKGENI